LYLSFKNLRENQEPLTTKTHEPLALWMAAGLLPIFYRACPYKKVHAMC